MQRRTKIVATIGPATDSPEMIDALISAGVNVFRMNFSHGSAAGHRANLTKIRGAADKLKKNVAVMGDLQGPKIRIARFAADKVELSKGDCFALDSSLPRESGNAQEVGLDYADLPDDVKPGDSLLLDDGRIVLEVESVVGSRIECRVEVGGVLSNNKGINLKGGGLSAPALTDKDLGDIQLAAELELDFLAVSFPRKAADMKQARTLLRAAGSTAGVVAKIERAEAVASDAKLDKIILASDGVMVARGDLGVEIGDAELIGVQKKIIGRCRALNRFVITATQMMETMIENPIPTRAEVFDVANAVLDGTDAVMLSAETATGKHPIATIEAMSRVCQGAERQRHMHMSGHRVELKFDQVDEAIAMATMYTANHLKGVKAILALTESGSTVLWMSRIRSGLPIYAMTRVEQTQRKVAFYRGVDAIPFDPTSLARHDVNRLAVQELVQRGIVVEGDKVILTKGDHMGILGGTNAMKILTVGEIV